ncbi:MAG: hypothetical protein ACI33N_02125 [Desulfovibrionaceae bacterium]|nr:hypothetical protein [Desulfovibrionaceae bacterium]
MDTNLHSRLKNCLQTILELEDDIREDVQRSAFSEEFNKIRGFLERIEQMQLLEEEVARMERATATFLSELQLAVRAEEHLPRRKRVLQ